MCPTAPVTTITPALRRRRGLTEQAAVAAVDRPAAGCACQRSARSLMKPSRRGEGTTLL